MEVVLEIKNLYKRFTGEQWVIEDLNLSVSRGEIVCMLGPSGCGKTTILRLICGFERPDRGVILKNGTVLSGPAAHLPPERRRVGMVFQDYALFPHLTVLQNVEFGLKYRRRKNQDAQKKIQDLLGLTGIGDLARRYPHELSGGQQQRTALARALAHEPELILLDEPFSNIDTALRQHLRDDVKRLLRDAGCSAIFVTHDQEEALYLADTIAVMHAGRLEQAGSPEEVLYRPRSRVVADFIGRASYLPGRINDGRVETELGNWPLPPEYKGNLADPVSVLVRPDAIEIVQNGEGYSARVVRVQFSGLQPLYTLALSSGLELLAQFPGSVRLREGVGVVVCFRPFGLAILPG